MTQRRYTKWRAELLALRPHGTRFSQGRGVRREGKLLILLAILLPVLFGLLGLVFDIGQMMLVSRQAQHAADAASTAAATELRLGRSTSLATSAAIDCVRVRNQLANATVTVHSPPMTGPYANTPGHVEVMVQMTVPSRFMRIANGRQSETVTSRAVAGYEPATAGAAIVVLDPDPAPLTIASLPLALPSLPSLVGGLEILGLGKAEVHGAVLVNTRWGGKDENYVKVGEGNGPPYGVACTPLLPLTRLKVMDLRVTGGVDDPSCYSGIAGGNSRPLRANKLPVPDPLRDLPVPTTSTDSLNVSTTNYGGKTVIGLPIGPQIKLYPGVYDYIDVVIGRVKFMPGIYIIRGQHPVTKHSLLLVAGEVEAEGVMFYLTNTAGYSAVTGSVDASDGETEPAGPLVGSVVPSAIINIGLLGSSFTPLDSPGSPFHGMIFYQRRQDRRPIVFVQENLLGAGRIEGTIYAKWGHVILAGKGEYKLRVVAGTMRLIALLDCQIKPTSLLDPARDVFLME